MLDQDFSWCIFFYYNDFLHVSGQFYTDITWYHILAFVIFIYASWKQNKLGKILAGLRTNKRGKSKYIVWSLWFFVQLYSGMTYHSCGIDSWIKLLCISSFFIVISRIKKIILSETEFVKDIFSLTIQVIKFWLYVSFLTILGTVENTQHHIPRGDLFELCSCPHFFMEILIYAAIATVFLWQHEVCNCIFVFVIVNQTLSGMMSHKWYLQNFPSYPKHRTAVIPYLIWATLR